MNRCVLAPNKLNYFRVIIADKNYKVPEDEKEQILWAEKLYNDIVESGEEIMHKINVKKGWMISSWKYNDEYFIIMSLKNEYQIYENKIYVGCCENDCKSIATFLANNLNTIGKDYKKQCNKFMHDMRA